jgi:hypothetical protein
MYVSSDPGTYMVRIRFTFKTGCNMGLRPRATTTACAVAAGVRGGSDGEGVVARQRHTHRGCGAWGGGEGWRDGRGGSEPGRSGGAASCDDIRGRVREVCACAGQAGMGMGCAVAEMGAAQQGMAEPGMTTYPLLP